MININKNKNNKNNNKKKIEKIYSIENMTSEVIINCFNGKSKKIIELADSFGLEAYSDDGIKITISGEKNVRTRFLDYIKTNYKLTHGLELPSKTNKPDTFYNEINHQSSKNKSDISYNPHSNKSSFNNSKIRQHNQSNDNIQTEYIYLESDIPRNQKIYKDESSGPIFHHSKHRSQYELTDFDNESQPDLNPNDNSKSHLKNKRESTHNHKSLSRKDSTSQPRKDSTSHSRKDSISQIRRDSTSQSRKDSTSQIRKDSKLQNRKDSKLENRKDSKLENKEESNLELDLEKDLEPDLNPEIINILDSINNQQPTITSILKTKLESDLISKPPSIITQPDPMISELIKSMLEPTLTSIIKSSIKATIHQQTPTQNSELDPVLILENKEFENTKLENFKNLENLENKELEKEESNLNVFEEVSVFEHLRSGVWFGKHYNFPSICEGEPGIVAVISLGGGYKASDLEYYFKDISKLNNYPKIIDVNIGQDSVPNFTGNALDLQNTSDLELCGSFAKTILFISAPKDKLYDAYNACIEGIQIDTTKKHILKPKYVLCNYNVLESSVSISYMKNINDLLKRGTSSGITFISNSNDVSFPSTSEYVLSCGLEDKPSNIFVKPKYQEKYTDSTFRIIPDIKIEDDISGVIYFNNKFAKTSGSNLLSAIMTGYLSICNLYYPKSFHDVLYTVYSDPEQKKFCFKDLKTLDGINLLNTMKTLLYTEIPEIYGLTSVPDFDTKQHNFKQSKYHSVGSRYNSEGSRYIPDNSSTRNYGDSEIFRYNSSEYTYGDSEIYNSSTHIPEDSEIYNSSTHNYGDSEIYNSSTHNYGDSEIYNSSKRNYGDSEIYNSSKHNYGDFEIYNSSNRENSEILKYNPESIEYNIEEPVYKEKNIKTNMKIKSSDETGYDKKKHSKEHIKSTSGNKQTDTSQYTKFSGINMGKKYYNLL